MLVRVREQLGDFSGSVVMTVPKDLATYRPENPEDCTDDHEQDPDRPQDGNAGEKSDQEQDEPDDDHEVFLPGRAHNKPSDAAKPMTRLTPDSVDADPVAQFRSWYDDAAAAAVRQPEAMTLATATPDGAVSARTVLLRGIDERGFVFYTNLES